MKTILATFLTVLLLLPVSAIGEIQTVTHTVKQPFGGSQSADDARIAAIAKAKREALEMAGVYVEALTVVKDAKVDKDEILALTAGVLKSEVVSQENYHTKDAFGIEVVVRVIVDPSVLEARVKKLLQDRTYLDQYYQARKKGNELLDKVEKLEQENRKLMAKNSSSENVKDQFQTVTKELSAVEWFYKALAYSDGKKVTDTQKALECLNQSISLFPNWSRPYTLRALLFSIIKNYQQAITDLDRAILLEPENRSLYLYRGDAYKDAHLYKQAIEDYNKVISIEPNNADAYKRRGGMYTDIGLFPLAIEDYNKSILLKSDDHSSYLARGVLFKKMGKLNQALDEFKIAIHLDPNDASVYISRAQLYRELRKFGKSIEDCNKAILLEPDGALGYMNRAMTYSLMGKSKMALDDFSKAIQLEPNNAATYSMRGYEYLIHRNKYLGCSDLLTACKMGECGALEAARGYGDCR